MQLKTPRTITRLKRWLLTRNARPSLDDRFTALLNELDTEFLIWVKYWSEDETQRVLTLAARLASQYTTAESAVRAAMRQVGTMPDLLAHPHYLAHMLNETMLVERHRQGLPLNRDEQQMAQRFRLN